MEPNPSDQTEPTVSSQPTASAQSLHSRISTDRRITPVETELTEQVDDMMATSSEPDVAPEAPEETVAAPEPVTVGPVAVLPPHTVPAAPVVGAATTLSANSMPKKKRFWKKPIGVAVIVLAVVVVASGIGFAAVVVPQLPAYNLLKAVQYSTQQTQVSYTGTVETKASNTAIKIAINGSADKTKNAADVNLAVTADGITLPVEARQVNKNLYVKLGDLKPVGSILSAFAGPDSAPVITLLEQQLSSRWISIDSTLLDQAGASCYTNTTFTLTKADIKLIKSEYKKSKYVDIVSTSADTINGKKVTKYVLSFDDDKIAASGLSNLSSIKALEACSKMASKTKSVGDHDKTPLTIWIDKSTKQIVQIASKSTAADDKKGDSGTAQFTLNYAPVSISVPTDSTSAVEIFTNLEKGLGAAGSTDPTADLTKLLGGLMSSSSAGTTSSSSTSSAANDTTRQTDIASLQTQLEASNQTNSYYPTLAQLNSPSWRSSNMPGVDAAVLKDPEGSASALADTPAAHVYAYQPTLKSQPCTTDSKCDGYTLTATLSDGSAFSKTALD